MSDTITVTGLVATTPKHIVTSAGLAITSFRLASNQRRFDRTQQKWVDLETNWYTVSTFRQLAANVVVSLQTGQRVVVTGRLRVRDWTADDKSGRSVEIDADAVGHDLTWGTAAFTRSAAAGVSDAAGVPDPDVAGAAASGAGADPDAGDPEAQPSEPHDLATATPF